MSNHPIIKGKPMTTAKAIAEKIINENEEFEDTITLARAYLELEKVLSCFTGDMEVLEDTAGLYQQSKITWKELQAANKEITKLREANDLWRELAYKIPEHLKEVKLEPPYEDVTMNECYMDTIDGLLFTASSKSIWHLIEDYQAKVNEIMSTDKPRSESK